MSLLQIIILALIQGLTEFLPVSSSAHLVVAPELLGWERDQGPIFDLMAHFGTLFAVMIYFHKDLKKAVLGTRDLCRLKLNKGSALANSNRAVFTMQDIINAVDSAPGSGTIGGSITAGQIAFGAATANTIEGNANITTNGTNVFIPDFFLLALVCDVNGSHSMTIKP